MHIGIILDGNRRFAVRSLKSPVKGHEEGAKKVEELLDWIKEFNIKETTLYCFSIENFHRKKKEVDFLMKLFEKEFRKLGNDKRVMNDRVKIRFVGQKNLLNNKLQKIMSSLESKTKDNENYILNFAIAYGGRQEIIHAVKKMVDKGEEINSENLSRNLWINSEPDLIIRTGKEKRTSNFMPWQSVYSEWIFLDKMWPEFTKQDFHNAIIDFNNRERRFGR